MMTVIGFKLIFFFYNFIVLGIWSGVACRE